MMNVGQMRVGVRERHVAMPVGVRLLRHAWIVMTVLMVQVVNVEMIVGDSVVEMVMNMGLREHHP